MGSGASAQAERLPSCSIAINDGSQSEKRFRCVEKFIFECLKLKQNDRDTVLSLLSTESARENFFDFVNLKKCGDSITVPFENADGEMNPQDDDNFQESSMNYIDLIYNMNKIGEYLNTTSYRTWRAKEVGIVDQEVSYWLTYNNSMLAEKNGVMSGHAFFCMNDHEVARIIQFSSWFTKFISSADNIPFGVLVVRDMCEQVTSTRHDLSIIYVNNHFENMSGYSKVEVLGRNPKFLQGPDTDNTYTLKMSLAVQTKISFEGVVCNYRKDGEKFCNHICFKPISDESDHCDYWIGIMEDVTNRIGCNLTHLLVMLPDQIALRY